MKVGNNTLIEFDTLSRYKDLEKFREDNKEKLKQIEYFESINVEVPEEFVIDDSDLEYEERVTKYLFDPSVIHDIRETFMSKDKNIVGALIVTFSEDYLETPPLLVTKDEFITKVNELCG